MLLLLCPSNQTALGQDVLTSEVLLQLTAIAFFTLYNIRNSGSDDLDDFDCISKDEEV